MNKDILKIGAMAYLVLCFVGSGAAQNIPAIEMVFVEGGTFTMGCTAEQRSDCRGSDCWVWDDCRDKEYPPHSVTVSDFYIGKYEVTQKLWEAVMGSNPSYYKGDNLPVESVSWNDVQEFISKLNSITGKKYRLPTEAEWEYAARGGEKSKGYKYSGSNNINDIAWYVNNCDQTKPVGLKQPNELGIYDMTGNVGEWVDGWFVTYTSEAKTNPIGSLAGSTTEADSIRRLLVCKHCRPYSSGAYRMLRGCNWMTGDSGCRISTRGVAVPPCGAHWLYSEEVLKAPSPEYRLDIIGFRLALTAPK